MRLVKGAVLGVLNRSFRKDDEVVLISFRGTDAQVLLEPSHLIDDATTALEYLPTGGRTPLAHALETAKSYLTPATVLILLSDGRVNVPLRGGDPWEEALQSARTLHCRALLVNTENPDSPIQRSVDLANALSARQISLASLENLDILQVDSLTSETF
jgi:magnesium chelatase subunit D